MDPNSQDNASNVHSDPQFPIVSKQLINSPSVEETRLYIHKNDPHTNSQEFVASDQHFHNQPKQSPPHFEGQPGASGSGNQK